MIIAKGLTKEYGELTAVRNLCLHVKAGEIFGFLGPNGAGKTTSIKMFVGLLAPTRGTSSISGVDVSQDPVSVKKLVGFVPDTPNIYERLTAREFLEFVADLRRIPGGAADDRIEEMLSLFQLEDRADESLGGYSHGMKQKICIAAALLDQPKALFLDEPTVGLDPKSARLVKEVLRKMADDGAAVFLSTHILEIAERMCDRVGIIQNGSLIVQGTVDELRKSLGTKDESLEDLFLSLTGGEEYRELIGHLGSRGS